MSSRLERLRIVVARVFLAYCVVYTLFAVLFDYRSAPYGGISTTRCEPQAVSAETDEALRRGLIEEFAPTLVFSFGEPADLDAEVVVPYQLVPDPEGLGGYVWRGAVAFPTDYGATSFGLRADFAGRTHSLVLSRTVLRVLGQAFGVARVDAHIGDVEMFELYLRPAEEEDTWVIESLITFPHGKRRFDSAARVRCFRGSPILYVSRGKHALYPSLQECNNSSVAQRRGVHVTAEECGIGTLFYPSTAPEFDVGDRADPNNIFATSPTLRESGVFEGEDAWADCFYGGFGPGDTPRACRSRFRWW